MGLRDNIIKEAESGCFLSVTTEGEWYIFPRPHNCSGEEVWRSQMSTTIDTFLYTV